MRWRCLFKENMYLQDLFRHAQRKQLSKVFAHLILYKNEKRQAKLEQAYKEGLLAVFKRQLAVK